MSLSTTKVYQIAPEPLSLMECYIIKTTSQKIIVIDGGSDGYGHDNTPYIQSAVRAILGLEQNDYFEIEAWFLSHGHTDHFHELSKMLNAYTTESNYRINHLYFNFPAFGTEWKSQGGDEDYSLKDLETFKKGLDRYAEITSLPDFRYDTINGGVITPETIASGLTVQIDECAFDILQTWCPEDKIVNSTSTVIRLRVGNHSILFLGDAYIDTGKRLIATYGAEALKSEYVQLAHHGQNGTDKEFYLAIGTDKSKRLWPSPAWVWTQYRHTYINTDLTRSWFGLPEKPEEYISAGLDKAGQDIVSGLYKQFPKNATLVSDWTSDILNEQLAAEFD